MNLPESHTEQAGAVYEIDSRKANDVTKSVGSLATAAGAKQYMEKVHIEMLVARVERADQERSNV